MGTPIDQVILSLYRDDINLPEGTIMDSVELKHEADASLPEGTYKFTASYTPTGHSSFGLNLDDLEAINCFKVKVDAVDQATNTASIKYGDAATEELETGSSMAIRVKEGHQPYIRFEQPNIITESNFEANFLVWDSNPNYRLAGINKNKLEISLNGIPQALDTPISDYFHPETFSSNSRQEDENGQGYRIIYNFSNLIDGINLITIKIYDNDGNSIEETYSIEVDFSAPTINIIEPTPENGKPINSKTFKVVGTVDTTSEVVISIINSESGDLIENKTVNIDITTNNRFEETFTVENDGTYTIKVTATEQSGNSSEIIPIIFIIDTTGPIFKSLKFYREDTGELVDTLEQGIQYRIEVIVL